MAQFIQYASVDSNAIKDELIAGLLAPQAFTSPKYLYDALGSLMQREIHALSIIAKTPDEK